MSLTLGKPHTATLEHVKPKRLQFSGYADKPHNVKAACLSCNNAKGGLTLKQYSPDHSEDRK